MANPPKGTILNQHPITIEFAGRMISGTYTVWAGTISVSSAHGRKTARLGASKPDGLARIMLRELAQEGKA
jgi:hypothetical protein